MFSFLPAFLITSLAICERFLVDDLPYLADEDCGSCERIYMPVCGVDNITYTNECRFHCMDKGNSNEIAMYGPCIPFWRRTEVGKLTPNVTETDIIKIEYKNVIN